MLDRPSSSPQLIGSSNAAPLLMLPGTLCDDRLYAPALRRMGISANIPVLEGHETTAAMAQSILADAPPSFSLCGFSLGAIVALEIIAQAPERVERLALISCNPGVLDAEAAADRAALPQSDVVGAEKAEVLHRMAASFSPQAYRQQTAMTLTRADSWPRLRDIDVLTLIVCGANDRICPPALSIAMARNIPGARLVIEPATGHYLPIERPDLVAAELAAWLATPAHPPKTKDVS